MDAPVVKVFTSHDPAEELTVVHVTGRCPLDDLVASLRAAGLPAEVHDEEIGVEDIRVTVIGDRRRFARHVTATFDAIERWQAA